MNLNSEDRELLKRFFDKIELATKNHHLLYIDNIDFFREILEEYIFQNNLNENIVFNLFLNEIRHDELIYNLNKSNSKITLSDYLKFHPIDEKYPISNTVERWYEESTVNFSNDENILKTLTKKLIHTKSHYFDMMDKVVK